MGLCCFYSAGEELGLSFLTEKRKKGVLQLRHPESPLELSKTQELCKGATFISELLTLYWCQALCPNLPTYCLCESSQHSRPPCCR